MGNILKKTIELIKPPRLPLIVLFFCYLAYVYWVRWENPSYLPGDSVFAFDYWWYFQHRLGEGAIAQWNPYYIMGMPAIQSLQVSVSIFTPFLAFVNDFTPELFARLHGVGYFLGALSIYFFGRITGYGRFVALLPLALMFLTYDFSHFTYWTAYLNYFIFITVAVAFLYPRHAFFLKYEMWKWVLFALFLSLAFLGCKVELIVHTVGFFCILFAVSTLYQLQKGIKEAGKYFLLSFGSLGIAVLSNTWQLALLINAMKGGIRVTLGVNLSRAFDPSTYKWIYLSVVNDLGSSLIVLVVLNFMVVLLLKLTPFASRKLSLIAALILMVLVAGLEFLALNLRVIIHFTPPDAGISYYWTIFRINPSTFFSLHPVLPLAALFFIGLSFVFFFIRVVPTLSNLFSFWTVILAAIYIIDHRAFNGAFDSSFVTYIGYYFFVFGGLGMLIEKRTAMFASLVLFYFFSINGKYWIYDVMGVIWLSSRDFPLLMPFFVLLILEGVSFSLTGISAVVLACRRLRKPANHLPQFPKVFILAGQMACLILVFYATKMFAKTAPHIGGTNDSYTVLGSQYMGSRLTRAVNIKKYSTSQWQRVTLGNLPALPIYTQLLNVKGFHSTEIPRIMFNTLNPDLDIEGVAGWHPGMEPTFLQHLDHLNQPYPHTPGELDYVKMNAVTVPDNVLSREIVAYAGSKTERAFLTDQVVGFKGFKEELNFLKTIIASGGYLANQVTTSDPEFPGALLLESVKRFSSSLYGSNSSGGLAIQTGLLKKKRGVDYKLEFKKDSPELVVFEVESNEDAYLALMDLWGKGWRAYVDGQETKIYKGYVGARFIEVKKGKHIVKFKYRVPGFRMACILSLLAWGAIIGVGIRSSRSPAQEIKERFLAWWAVKSGKYGKFSTEVCIAGQFSEGIRKNKAKAFLASMGARFVKKNNGKARVRLEYRSPGFLFASLSSLLVWPVFMLVGARNCRVSINPAPEVESGKVFGRVLITGVSEGLGKEMARAFLSRQCSVLGISRRRPEQFDPENEWTGDDNFQHLAGDLESPVFRKELATMAKEHQVGLVIFNAALLEEDIVAGRFDSEKCRRMMELNCLCNLEIVQLICDETPKDRPMVFCAISSLSALAETNPNMVGYNTSKAALSMSFRALSTQYEGTLWRFVLMHPGKLWKGADGIFQVNFKTAAERIVSTLVATKGASYYFPLPNYVILKMLGFLPVFLRKFAMTAIRSRQVKA